MEVALSLPIRGALEGETDGRVAASCGTVAGSGQGLREPGSQGFLREVPPGLSWSLQAGCKGPEGRDSPGAWHAEGTLAHFPGQMEAVASGWQHVGLFPIRALSSWVFLARP